MPEIINVSDFDLAATLECGQAFRWRRADEGWFIGVVGKEVWQLRQTSCSVVETAVPGGSRQKALPPGMAAATTISHYLSINRSLPDIVATFPADDEILHAAVKTHWGLRVLRQEPWECLASFIASSTKQIVQIRQIVESLARCFGERIDDVHHAFPPVEVVARATHQQLWDCKLGFRAKNLLAAARMIDSGKIEWGKITAGTVSPPLGIAATTQVAAGTPLPQQRRIDYESALEELLKLPGVGEKVANCTLLFSCGYDQAFPINVWIERALRRIYFEDKKKVTSRELREFAWTHFGPHAGWAQQYLFFNERLLGKHRARRGQPLLDVGAK